MLQFKKSSDPDFLNYKHIELQLDLLLKEQRNQRLDLANLNALTKRLLVDKDLQTTVDKYFERDETSPQTDQDEHMSQGID